MSHREALPYRYILMITNVRRSQAMSFCLPQRATTMDLSILRSHIVFKFKRKEEQLDGIYTTWRLWSERFCAWLWDGYLWLRRALRLGPGENRVGPGTSLGCGLT